MHASRDSELFALTRLSSVFRREHFLYPFLSASINSEYLLGRILRWPTGDFRRLDDTEATSIRVSLPIVGPKE